MPLRSSYRQSSGSAGKFVVVIVVIAAAAALFFLQRELRLPPPARAEITTDLPGVGRKTVFTVRAEEPKLGLSRVVITADGAGFSHKVLRELTLQGDEARKPVVIQIPLGKEPTPDIKPGPLTLEVSVEARGTRLRHPAAVVARNTTEVRLNPPALSATSAFVHLAQGGAEAVVYEVAETASKHGVQVGSWFFPGSPLPGGAPTQRFVLFAAPYDMEVSETEARGKVLLVAEDQLGNRSEMQFIHKYIRRPMHRDTIELSDALMQKVTGEIYARTPQLVRKGNVLEDYLQINRDLRQQNMAELMALAARSQPRFLWNAGFLPMQNAAVKGNFADRRAYMAGGKQVDTQDHLGLDLASLKQAPVQATNSGKVVMAKYFGVFGNCVVVDHGFGLMSLSAHLSTITVKEGDNVSRGQELGRTGATGLAGGDHLHFTMVLHGLPVTPIEWWDDHWIQDRIKLKLGDALPWKGDRG
jgi:murein DD-endopeptidase MepM/ murein hydrolase activator NlpD